MLVDGRTGGLDKVNVASTDGCLQLDAQLGVGKSGQSPRGERNPETLGD